MRIAILSTTDLPRFLGSDHPNKGGLFAEDDLLIAAFADLGVQAQRIAWRRRGAEWAGYDFAVIRSTWDYIDHVPSFLETLAAIEAAGCRLINPLDTVRWNLDKRYLGELAAAGVPIVPTRFLQPGDELSQHVQALGPSPGGYIVKPTVGVGAYGMQRLRDSEAVRAWTAPTDARTPHLVQPFVDAIESEGEWSFVFGGGRYLYCALKVPARGDFRVQVIYGASTQPRQPAREDLQAAQACFEALPVQAHLARIDMARSSNGRLALMEAELIEPQLYFFDVPSAAAKVAGAVLDSVDACG